MLVVCFDCLNKEQLFTEVEVASGVDIYRGRQATDTEVNICFTVILKQ